MMAAMPPTIPAAPGPSAEAWYCKCGNMLGVVAAGWLWSRFKGREVAAALPAQVTCERCHRRSKRLLDVGSCTSMVDVL